MPHSLIRPLIFAAFIVAAGCTSLNFPGVHKVEIQQGNIITQEMIDQLRPGMTKSQVRFVMGTPLITDPFNLNRWDYFYSLDDRKNPEVRERVVIFFDENERLIRFRGDYLPSVSTEAGQP